MAFNDSPQGPFISPDKIPAMNRVANSAIYWHSVYEQRRKQVRNAQEAITKFLLKDLSEEMKRFMVLRNAKPEEFDSVLKAQKEDKEHPIISAYAPENQHIFSGLLTELEMAANIVPVILNIQKEMNAMPKRFEQQQQPQQQPSGNVFIDMGAALKNRFGKKTANYENVAYIDAYSRTTNLMDRWMQIPVIISSYSAFHAQRVTDSIEFFRGNRKSQMYLLYVEWGHYESVVKNMVNAAFMESMRINMEGENPVIGQMLGRGQDMHERRDLLPKFTPTE